MRDQLLNYYESELRYIRRMVSQFAAKYPAVAQSLLIEPEKCEDPHVERLIEAFSMLTARIHMRLDDEFPELANSLLGIVYPHYTAPIPSMTIVSMGLGSGQGQVEQGITVDTQSTLYSKPVDGVRCRFRTCYPVTLWPIKVNSAKFDIIDKKDPASPVEADGKISLEIKTEGETPFSEYSIDKLRFFLNGEPPIVHRLYEGIFIHAKGLLIRTGSRGRAVFLDSSHIKPVGFNKTENILEYPNESFTGYRLLNEYFTFPDKFMFFELVGLDSIIKRAAGESISIEILLDKRIPELIGKLSPDNFMLGCAPAINLFSHKADPISMSQQNVEHQVIPDVHSPFSFEVYSIKEVSSSTPGTDEIKTFRPFYSLQHGDSKDDEPAFWHPIRRETIRKDDTGTDVFLTLVDKDFKVTDPPLEVLSIDTLCTNRDLPSRLPFGDARGDFQLEGYPEITMIRCLRKPTASIRSHLEDDARWKLISHLSLNYLSITEFAGFDKHLNDQQTQFHKGKALESFHEILKLYDFMDSSVNQKRISGLTGIKARRITRRLKETMNTGFARGMEISLEFDEEKYAGSGVFLFASVLEQFLGHYVSINSFVQTVAYVRQREGVLKRWPPRAGQIQLL